METEDAEKHSIYLYKYMRMYTFTSPWREQSKSFSLWLHMYVYMYIYIYVDGSIDAVEDSLTCRERHVTQQRQYIY